MFRISGIWFGFLMLSFILGVIQRGAIDEYGQPTYLAFACVMVRSLVGLAVSLFTLILMCKTRRHIRNKYSIPQETCNGCEDCCCVYFCTCCTLSQMARHTADYETYRAACCSETGLPPHVSINEAEMMTSQVGSIV